MEEENKAETLLPAMKTEKRSYVHVSEEGRLMLLVLINDNGIRLSRAARMLGIKYTTARHVIKKFNASPKEEQAELLARARILTGRNHCLYQ